MSWRDGKRWSDRFLPEIKAILGVNLMCEPVVSEDREHNTDLIVVDMQSKRIACRIRRWEYHRNYHKQFTIRYRSGDSRTEIHKIMDGWGDYILYGFADDQQRRLAQWFIGDLDVFRERHQSVTPEVRMNADKSTALAAFDVREFGGEFVVAWGGTHYGREVFANGASS